MNWRLVLQKNYQQLLFIFGAFFLMVIFVNYSVSEIVRKNIFNSANEALRIAEANVKLSLREPEVSLAGIALSISGMVERGVSQDVIRKYMIDMTKLLESEGVGEGLIAFSGIYGSIRGEYLDGSEWTPPPDYVVQERPWFIAASAKSGKIAMTKPYVDTMTNTVAISFSQELYTSDLIYIGVLAVDVYVTNLFENVRSLRIAEGGYGVILNENLEVIAHKNPESTNKLLRDIPGDYSRLAGDLESKGEVSAAVINDYDGAQAIVFFRRLYNDWYAGMVTPLDSFYGDISDTALKLSILGFSLMSALFYILLRLSMAKIRSDEENRSKTSFLARMSHEIRTPMNAIIGMSELALRSDSAQAMSEYVRGIKQSGHNLLSIINDILDLSRIESGNIEIAPAQYQLSSLMNDVVNVVRVRIVEKPIIFTVYADGGIPNSLIGDESRTRQILLNLLSNATKYTDEGFVKFSVNGLDAGDGNILLSFGIEDSGIGIRSEELRDLFGNFVRLDTERNRGVEGTGLGLAITKNLCLAMGGDVAVSSVYGKGSTFTATIPQKFVGQDCLARVENPESKQILFFDERPLYAESILLTIQNLRVPVTAPKEREEFHMKLESNAFAFAFASSGVVERAAEQIKSLKLRTKLVMLAGLGEISSFQDVPIISMPAYAVPIANVLNGITTVDSREDAHIRFIAPSARVLVVDDNVTNLRVAHGLLLPYRMHVDICESGKDAVSLAKANAYDMIFMDHMMPVMDGIEATAILRSIKEYAKTPIVALTANAVSGMRELFLESGMNDFLSKPIDPVKLDNIIHKWIPKHKQTAFVDSDSKPSEDRSNLSLPHIDGINFGKALSRFGGNTNAYLQVLRSFVTHTPAILEKLRTPVQEDLHEYAIAVHGVKGSSYNICAELVGWQAEELEVAAKSGNFAIVESKNDAFINAAEKLISKLSALLDDLSAEGEKEQAASPDKSLLHAILDSCGAYDVTSMEASLSALERYTYENGGDLVAWLREQFENLEYDQIRERLERELRG
jgi:signal transduction histidine kinase/CheY-like chemotaxis protein